MFDRLGKYFNNRYRNFLRNQINQKNRNALHNSDFSLISSNCNGTFLLHDLGLQFRTPTVNLWMMPDDYIEFLSGLSHYISIPIEFSDELEQNVGYPVGVLNHKVKIYFQHYQSREEAERKWVERCSRISLDNLFIMFTDRDGCTYENIHEFDRLPYKNKVIFTHKPYPEFQSAFCIKGFEKDDCVGMCFAFKGKWTGEKYYDDFPYVKWFNGELIK